MQHNKDHLLKRPPYPRGLLVDIHSYCNASCRICPYPQLSKVNPMGFMSWDLYTKILDDYKQLMDRYNFTGVLGYCQMSEPFILKDIARWVKYAMDKKLRVYFNTNASLLSPAIVDSLVEIGFNGFFNISFHGITRETYENIMHLDYDSAMNNIEHLLKKFPPINIRINAVCFGWGANEEKKIRSFWKSKGISAIISKAQSRTGLVAELNTVSRRRIAGCGTERVFYEMVVSFNGDVLLCCNDMAREVIIGNLNDVSIEDVWNGDQFVKILQGIYNDRNLPLDFICKRCEESEDYWSLRRIVKSIMPERILRAIQEARDSEWIVNK
ncbi:MAG TPA: radical SAM protein [Syntrophales bacterium]|nr:radical SAM protein [Syntrophales bacterium]